MDVGDDEAPPPRPPRRGLALALALAGMLGLAYAAVSTSWLANPDLSGVRGMSGSVQVGPLGFEACTGGECYSLSNAALVDLIAATYPLDRAKYTSAAFQPAGWVTMFACLVAALGLGGAAAIALARRTPELRMSPASLALVAIIVAMIAGCVFVATKPGPPGMVGVSIGFAVFGAGALLGLAGAQLLARSIRPADPDLLADSMDPDEYG